MIDLLRALLLTAHLLASALAGAGPLVVAGVRLSRGARVEADSALWRVAWWSVAALAAGLLFGAVSLAIVWATPSSGYRDAVLRFPVGAWWMLGSEWLFSLVLHGLFLATWRKLAERPILHGLIALVSATNLLYHFPTMMVVLGALAEAPALTAETEVARPVFRTLLLVPPHLAMAGHFVSMSFLTAAAALLWSGARDAAEDNRLGRPAGIVALLAVAALMITGVTTLVQLPAADQRALLGGDPAATVVFAAGVGLALAIAHAALGASLGDAPKSVARRAALLIAVATACMAWVSLRTAAL